MPHRARRAPTPVPYREPGVYRRYQTDPMARPTFYAVLWDGTETESCIPRDGETDRDIRLMLADRVDASRRPALTLASGGYSQSSAGLGSFVPPPLRVLRGQR